MREVKTGLLQSALRVRKKLKSAVDAVAGGVIVTLLRGLRRVPLKPLSKFSGRVARRIGPWFPEHRIGRANLAAAFPEKTADELDATLGAVYENLGRIGAEYSHLGRLIDRPQGEVPYPHIDVPAATAERFLQLRDDGKPALIFAAHLTNWELPAIIATANGLDTSIVYRAPNIGDIAEEIARLRAVRIGALISTSGFDAPFKVAAALERGGHVGMLVDQHFSRGVDVTFFGRTCKANPLLARLARRFECPIHGTRAVRLPHGRFRVELTEAIEPARAADGQIDVQATMQIVTSIIEGWVREHPEQWLWLHRRWR
jgi:KDO2-lipid IV(A) lauroyltransferase